MEGNLLMAAAGVLMSLSFAYVPGLHQWYEKADGVRKGQVMLLALLVAALIILFGSCYLRYAWITCDEAGWKQLAELFLAGLLANQAVYQVWVKPHQAAAALE